MTLQESISYYRSRLSDFSKFVYDCLYHEMQKDMIASGYQFSAPHKCCIDDCSAAYTALTLDHPEFYPLQYGVTIRFSSDVVSIKPNKSFSQKTAIRIERKLQSCISDVTRKLRGRTEFEKEFLIYTRLTKMLTYSNKEKATHSILAPVLNHNGSCDGRSKLLTLCLRAVGIPCIVVRGKNHMWNMASIDGHNVWLDCTYETMRNDRLAYFYFNLDDRQLKIDHVIESHLPKCTDNGYDFFSKFRLAFTTRQEAVDYIRAKCQEGADSLSFKIEGADEHTLISVMKDGLLLNGSDSCTYILNQSGNAVFMSLVHNEQVSP